MYQFEKEHETKYILLLADEQMLIKQECEDMEFMVRKLVEEYETWGLKINLEKSFYMGCGTESIGRSERLLKRM